MLSSTRGIVLHAVKFRENSLIVTIYTETYGRQTYIINDTRGSRAKNKAAFFQPLFIVDLEVYVKKERDIQRIKESRLAVPYGSIPFNILKSSQVIFLAEVLYKVLREEECNPELYRFIENALIYFDISDKKTPVFHCWFLTKLTEYLGILPNTGQTEKGWLDMQKGIIVDKEPPHPAFMNPGTTALLIKLLELNISDLPLLPITKAERNLLLLKLLEYYHHHFETLATLHTLSVLKEVFE
jgi:DNA repair protein RecO (recombination protein O)